MVIAKVYPILVRARIRVMFIFLIIHYIQLMSLDSDPITIQT